MRADSEARVVLTPIATPLPLTFVGLLLATTLLSALELGWIPAGQSRECGWVLLAVPIPLQLIAAVFGFRGRSATAATGSSALAAAWLGIALSLIQSPPAAWTPSRSVGMLAFAVAASLLIPAVSDAAGESYLPAGVLALTAVRFTLTGIVAFSESTGLKQATGILGLVVAGAAFYAAGALELEGSRNAPLLPTFRGPHSMESLRAPFAQQVAEIEHEAGVRKNL